MTIKVIPRTGRALTGKFRGVFITWGDDGDMRHLSEFINSANWAGWCGMEFDFIWHEGFVHFTTDEARAAFLGAWSERVGIEAHSEANAQISPPTAS